jgi:hypothetical protein
VELRFVAPDLHRLDDTPAEVIACGVWSDERPMRGLAGLLDWRLAGRVSKLLRESFTKGEVGDVLCVQGRPRLPYEKVLFVGVGERASFDEERFRTALARLLGTLSGLHVKRAVVELPGRAGDRIAPERAAELALEAARDSEDHDAWWLVEPPEAQAKIASRTNDERRRGLGASA